MDRTPRTTRSRLRDLGLYLLIGFIVACSPLLAAVTDVPIDNFLRWWGIVFFTFFVFGFFIEGSRPLWKKRTFWVWTAIFFLAHTLIFAILAIRGVTWTGHSLWIISVAESAVLIVFRRVV